MFLFRLIRQGYEFWDMSLVCRWEKAENKGGSLPACHSLLVLQLIEASSPRIPTLIMSPTRAVCRHTSSYHSNTRAPLQV